MAKESSTNNSLCHGGGIGNQSPEESGWTIYFEDFLNTNYHDEPSFFSSDISPDHSYAVADAASSVANHKLVGVNDGAAVAAPELSCKDMNFFKKRKIIKKLFVEDDSLEDTASSPVNSPKDSDATYFSKNGKHKENLITPQVDERREMGFVGIGRDCTELKKIGLCLVPLSMVVNYLNE